MYGPIWPVMFVKRRQDSEFNNCVMSGRRRKILERLGRVPRRGALAQHRSLQVALSPKPERNIKNTKEK